MSVDADHWEERVLQHSHQPINCRLVNHSLLPYAREVAQNGGDYGAFYTATQMLNENIRTHQPTTVHFGNQHYAHNKAGMVRYREM